jgi:hypothetical protein
MRAAWSRRTDQELVRAYFLEELSPDGRALVGELMVEKFGAIATYLETFAREQGDVIATFPVRGFEVGASVKDQRLPVMWGFLVLATHGIGFVPGGVDDGAGIDDAIAIGLGPIARAIASSMISTIDRARTIVARPSESPLPLPLLATLEPGAVWLPRAAFDEVLWGPDFGEVVRSGERLCCLEPTDDAEEIVVAWAEAHDVALTGLEPAPLLR